VGYVGGSLADALPQEPIDRFARRTTRRVGEHLCQRVAYHTPVARPFEHESMRDFVARRHRTPGTLKRSWKVGEMRVSYGGRLLTIDVLTHDPVAPHVEWNTRPHIIVPRDPNGMLVFETERGTVWAKIVHHPGTQGVHMLATALAEVAVTWRAIAKREWAETVRRFYVDGGPE